MVKRTAYFRTPPRAVLRIRISIACLAGLLANCLSIDPSFIGPHISSLDSSETQGDTLVDTVEDNLESGTATAGVSSTDGSTESDGTNEVTGETEPSPDDFGGTDTDNSTNGGEIGEESSTGMESETGVATETSNTDSNTDSTTSGSSTSSGEDSASSTSAESTSGSSSGDTSSDTSDVPSGDASSDSSDVSSEETGAEPCVPQLCMSANTSGPLEPLPWTYSDRLYAFRFDSTELKFVFRAEIATGEASGTGTISIWSDRGDGQRPESPLESGSWQMNQQNSWQGADFTTPVAISNDRYYWLVWELPYRAQAPIARSGSFTPYSWSANNGTSWNNDTLRGMYRMYCCETNQ